MTDTKPKRVSSHKLRKSLSESFKERLMSEMERVVCQAQRMRNGQAVPIDTALDTFVRQNKIDRKLAAGLIWALVGQHRLDFHNDFRGLTTTEETVYCPKVTADQLARVPRPKPGS